jgi:hypothetical protein
MARKFLYGGTALLVFLLSVYFACRHESTIGINVLSDIFTFAILISTVVFLAQFNNPKKAKFFGFNSLPKVSIRLSENANDPYAGKQLNVHEYKAAVELEKMLLQTEDGILQGILNRLLRLVGQEPIVQVDTEIRVVSHDDPPQFPSTNTILIGGPEANRLTKYLQEEDLLNFQFHSDCNCEQEGNEECDHGYYREKVNDGYSKLNPPTAFIEKSFHLMKVQG